MIRFHPKSTEVMESAITLILIFRQIFLHVSRWQESGPAVTADETMPFSCCRPNCLCPRDARETLFECMNNRFQWCFFFKSFIPLTSKASSCMEGAQQAGAAVTLAAIPSSGAAGRWKGPEAGPVALCPSLVTYQYCG